MFEVSKIVSKAHMGISPKHIGHQLLTILSQMLSLCPCMYVCVCVLFINADALIQYRILLSLALLLTFLNLLSHGFECYSCSLWF